MSQVAEAKSADEHGETVCTYSIELTSELGNQRCHEQ